MAKTSPTPPPSGDLEAVAAAPPESYAEKASEAFEKLSEGTKSFAGKTIEFLSTGAKKMWEIFKDANLFGKGTMVAAGVVVGLAANKIVEKVTGFNVIEKGLALFRATWDRMTGLGDSLGAGLDKIRGISIKKTISILLGSTALVALFANFSDLKACWDEANDHKDGLLAGLQAGITTRVVNGVFDISDEKWDELAEEHSWFPSRERRDKAQEVLDDVRQGAAELKDNVTEGISEAIDWVAEFDERGRLKQLREEIATFFEAEGITGWESMGALQILEDPTQVAQYLGLTTSGAREEFYLEMDEHSGLHDLGVTGAIGGGTYLLYKLLGSGWKESLAMTGANVALYMLFQSRGIEDSLVGIFDELHETVTQLQVEIEKITRHFNIQPAWLNMEDGKLNLKTAMDFLFKVSKEHPDFTALSLVNGVVLGRGVLWYVATGTLKLLFMSLSGAAEFAMENPMASGIVGSLVLLTVIERREVVRDLAGLLYPGDDPESQLGRREFIDDMHRYLKATGILALDENPGAMEAGLKPLFERTQDAEEFIADPDNRLQIIEHLKEGKLSLAMHGIGTAARWTLGVVSGSNPIYSGLVIESYVVDSIIEEIQIRGLTCDNVGVYATYAGEIIIGSRLIFGAGKGYISLFSDINDFGSMVRLTKSLFPITQEYWSIIQIAAREVGDTLPYAEFTHLWHAFRISRLSVHVNKLLEFFEEMQRLDRDSPRYRKLRQKLTVRTSKIESLTIPPRGDLVKYQDIELFERLSVINRQVQVITEAAVEGTFKNDLANDLVRDVSQLESRLSRRLAMGRQLAELQKLRGGVDNPAPIAHGQEITLKQIEALSDPVVRAHAESLSRLGLSRQSILQLDQAAGWTESNMAETIAELRADPELTPKMNQIAYEAKYARSLSFVRQFHKYGGLAMVIGVLWGYHESENKAEFLINTTSHLGGFSGGVASVRIAEKTVTGKLPPLVRLVADLGVGIFGATELGTPLAEFWNDKVYREHPNINVEGTRFSDDAFWAFDAGFETLTAAGLGRGMFDGVDENTHPVDYLSHTIRTFKPIGEKDYFKGSMRRDYYHRFDDDMAFSAQKTIDGDRRKLDKKKDKLKGLDLSSEKAMKLEKDIERLEAGIDRMQTYVDGSWVKNVRMELMLQAIIVEAARVSFATIANEEFPGQFGDRGMSVVNSMVSRLGTGQPIIDDEDKDIWQYIYDYGKVKITEGVELSFTDFVQLASTVKRRRKQMQELGYAPLPSNEQLEISPNTGPISANDSPLDDATEDLAA